MVIKITNNTPITPLINRKHHLEKYPDDIRHCA